MLNFFEHSSSPSRIAVLSGRGRGVPERFKGEGRQERPGHVTDAPAGSNPAAVSTYDWRAKKRPQEEPMSAWIYRAVLRLVPTWALQEALGKRPAVQAEFIGPGKEKTFSVRGVCWVTISED